MFKEMLKRSNYLFMLIIVAFGLSFTSCSDDDEDSPTNPVTINESEVLATYLESMNLTFPKITTAEDVNKAVVTSNDKVYLIDIRSAEHFAEGHVKGSHNVAFADLLTHMESITATDYENIVIICYTGQAAAYGASLMRMMGYNNVTSMKFGMSSWHSENAGTWNGAIKNDRSSMFTSNVTPKGAEGKLPTLSTGKKTGAEILRARVEAALVDGFDPAKTSNVELYGNLTGNYIINYWSEEHYLDPGHVEGAIQYTPNKSLTFSTDLKTLPTDKPVVVYCYTGQTSAFVTAYLRVLGYDAKSLLYGTNGMIYDIMKSKSMTIWSDSQIKNYEKVTD